ncbi:MAG: replicative DNA helicase [Erysipelotrichaceae bacterium]|nr:replicative DNA helicase [Erysipelotrichaceae bacterium]MBQ3962752.1 replicative DNA helicase [Erysipelotrichaceae bacterium]MBQ4019466.1 replicative DNA helicase [Erysipelotrichaceae bacterium]
MSSRSMPYSIEAEESLLGNIMLYPDAMRQCVDAGVTADDFYLDKHRQIYNLMHSMYENKEKVDTVSLSSRLKDFGVYDKIGGLEYLMQLANATISANNTGEYISIIRNKSLARKVIKVGEEISNDAYDSSVSVDEMLENVERKVTEVTRSKTSADFKTGEEIFDATIKHIQAIQEAGTAITGVKTKFRDLDSKTAGFQKGDLIIVAARPSMGKTALALNLAMNSAEITPGAVAIFSLEMPAEQVATRILAANSGVEIQKLRTGQLNDEDWSKVNEATQRLKQMNFFIDDTPGIKVSEMYAKARKLAQDEGLYMIVVDYIQLIQATGKSDSRQQEVSEISRRLKAMARELNVPLIALSQLSRSVEARQDKRPMLSDLRESGALEQDADLVLFLYRDAYYNRDENDNSNREDVELLIAKHRNGPTGKVLLAFQKEINAFYGIANAGEENA